MLSTDALRFNRASMKNSPKIYYYKVPDGYEKGFYVTSEKTRNIGVFIPAIIHQNAYSRNHFYLSTVYSEDGRLEISRYDEGKTPMVIIDRY